MGATTKCFKWHSKINDSNIRINNIKRNLHRTDYFSDTYFAIRAIRRPNSSILDVKIQSWSVLIQSLESSALVDISEDIGLWKSMLQCYSPQVIRDAPQNGQNLDKTKLLLFKSIVLPIEIYFGELYPRCIPAKQITHLDHITNEEVLCLANMQLLQDITAKRCMSDDKEPQNGLH